MLKLIKIASYFDKIGQYKMSDYSLRFANNSYEAIKSVADKVRSMHPYSFETHYDLLESLDEKLQHDPHDLHYLMYGKDTLNHEDIMNIMNTTDTFGLYEEIYPWIFVYPNTTTNTWFYRLHDPKDLNSINNPKHFTIHNTDVDVNEDIDHAVQKIHQKYPEALIDPFAYVDGFEDL